VLVNGGDHLRITGTDLDLGAAASLGTLVTGWVPVRPLRRDGIR
jgi:hypothetical protein